MWPLSPMNRWVSDDQSVCDRDVERSGQHLASLTNRCAERPSSLSRVLPGSHCRRSDPGELCLTDVGKHTGIQIREVVRTNSRFESQAFELCLRPLGKCDLAGSRETRDMDFFSNAPNEVDRLLPSGADMSQARLWFARKSRSNALFGVDFVLEVGCTR